MGSSGDLAIIDMVIIVVQFLAVFAFGVWVSRRSDGGTLAAYFLAGRRMCWWLVGLSLFVSNIGPATFIGIAGAASSRGFPVIAYEFSALFCLLMLGNLFMPVYVSAKVFTMPEYIQKRYGGTRLSVLLALAALFVGITASLCGEMYAGIVIIQQTLGWDLYGSMSAILLLTAIYTIGGGLPAVIYTDGVQSVLILIGSLILAITAFANVGVFNVFDMYMAAIPNDTIANSTCGLPRESDWHIFQSVDDLQYPWPGVGFGTMLLSSYYWCTNQIIVQRTLAARSLNHAKVGSVLAGYLKILPMFMVAFPGMISRALFPDEVACQTPETCMAACGNPKGCSDTAYPKLLMALLPTGLRGVLLSAMLSALISTMTSVFNSLSTVFALDIWTKIRKSSSDRELLIVGRVTTAVVAVIAVLWIPVIQVFGAGELFFYIQSIAAYVYPPAFAIFIVGVLWERATEKGAFAGLITGVLLGAVRLVCDFIWETPGCGQPDTRPGIIKKLPFLHYALLLLAVSLAVIVVVSLLTEPIPREKLFGLTWWTRNHEILNNRSNVLELRTGKRIDETNERGHKSRSDMVLKYLCCMDEDVGLSNENDEQRKETPEDKEALVVASPIKSWLININSVICFCVGVAVYIIFG